MPSTLLDRTRHFGSVTIHRRGRRRAVARTVLVLGTVLAAVTTVAVRNVLIDDSRRQYLAATGWPSRGQAAYQLGDADPQLGPRQQSRPIASLAKVMTALLVLRALPLPPDSDGPVLTVTAADVRDTARRAARDESVVRVRRGERLTERQALLALLLPSANNVAAMLASFVAGSTSAFVMRMNAAALALQMRDTRYTDPSGYDEATVSTAADQLRLATAAAADAVFSALVARRSAVLPVAGRVMNTDTLLGRDGFVGTKTGSDDAAGGCFMFRTRRIVDGRAVDLIGVVLGQDGHGLVAAGLFAARQLAHRVAPVVA